MLTAATLGMVGYGIYSVARGLTDLLGPTALELIVDLALIGFGLILMVAAAFVRVMMPGGLSLAIGAMLGLQALAIHNAAHRYGQVSALPQIALGFFAASLALLAYAGARRERHSGAATGDADRRRAAEE